MDLRTSLTLLLAAPTATLVMFSGLAFTAWALQGVTSSASNASWWEAAMEGALAELSWRQTLRQLWKQAKTDGTSALAKRLVRVTAAVVMAWSVGFCASSLVLLPYYAARALTGRPVPAGILLWIVGGVIGVFSLAKCLRWSAGRAPKDKLFLSGPSFRLVDPAVAPRDRAAFNHRIYLYHHLRWAVVTSLFCGPFLVITGLSADVTTVSRPTPPLKDLTWTAETWAELLLLCSLGLALLVFVGITKVVTAALSPVHAAVTIHRWLAENKKAKPIDAAWARNPPGLKRQDLDNAAQALARAGHRLDRAARGHPLASVLLGCSLYLRRFLMSRQALTDHSLDDIRKLLKQTVAVLAKPATHDTTVALAESVNAFDDEGQPRAALRAKTPRRWTLLLGRSGDWLERLARVVGALWAIFSLAVVIFLIITGRLALTSFQLQ